MNRGSSLVARMTQRSTLRYEGPVRAVGCSMIPITFYMIQVIRYQNLMQSFQRTIRLSGDASFFNFASVARIAYNKVKVNRKEMRRFPTRINASAPRRGYYGSENC